MKEIKGINIGNQEINLLLLKTVTVAELKNFSKNEQKTYNQ